MEAPKLTNHAPVTLALFANAIAGVTIAFLKAKYNIDFAGQEANLQMIATGIGYFVAGKELA